MDILNQKFGKLTAIELLGRDKYYDKIWLCECECGNKIEVKQGHLRSGHTTSCGCRKNQLESLKNKRFGMLTVIDRADDYICPGNNKHYVQWLCKCDCGNETIVLAGNLKNKTTTSCGCNRTKDLTNQTFGDLTVIKRVDDYINKSGRKLVRYECKCNCGNTIYTLANTLMNGDSTSCGCKVNSKGEAIVSMCLKNENLEYTPHQSFEDCLSPAGYKLNFDFYVPQINTLIECNGLQHYESVDFFGGDERYKLQQKHDEIKKEYALSHNYNYLVLDCRRNKLKDVETTLKEFLSSVGDKEPNIACL